MSDPYYSNVILLMHCDGTNGSTSFIDNAPTPNTLTANGSGQISTATPQYGTGAYSNGGAGGSSVSAPSGGVGGALDVGTGDFTVELALNSLSADTFSQGLIGCVVSGTSGWYISFNNPTAEVRAQLLIGGVGYSVPTNSSITKDTYHQLALVRSGTTYTIYLDGTAGPSPLTQAGALGTPGTNLYVGAISTITSISCANIDEIRITKGVARYIGSSYTPPTGAFPDSGAPAGGTVYGKFLDAGGVFSPIQSANLGNAKPRLYQPFENHTVKVSREHPTS